MNIPESFYYLIGGLIVANFGQIIAGFWAIGKFVWFMAKLDSQVKENSKDIDMAHVKIRELERGE